MREPFEREVIKSVKADVVRALEVTPTHAPETAELLAELRALRRIAQRISRVSEQARAAFGIQEDDL